ncbi:hypothetical protein EJ04DRAFT_77012 [Polyplosphaeria fusca]|uniref:6-phosphogluconate dehydrogenase n=1 Tax=Polyplosphaeria fusca TaxID=682080 RepID=A0A9P4UXR1_9PLEO|nr:hypothetical protein EJ04DRAFT_77012 [Polyplosphaeria fusca]
MPTLATVGILSIGQMGLGVAELLVASNYAVLTNVSDRSAATQKRAHDASLVLVDSDVDLVAKSDYIISIVPPRDAVATADRIANALQRSPRQSPSPLYYLDLNAIAPSTAARIASAFAHQNVRFIDGGIIGGPPTRSPDGWSKPGIPLSGPHTLSSAPASGAHVASVLNTRHVDARIGRASGLKCCFAALTKGMTALALQSYTTASALDVLPHLQHYMDMHNPSVRARAEKSIVACPGKAYRWVEEMRQIGEASVQELEQEDR